MRPVVVSVHYNVGLVYSNSRLTSLKVTRSVCWWRDPLTGPRSGQQGDDEGQAEPGDVSRGHRRPAEPHVEPVVPHAQPLSHRAVLHVWRHAADPPPGYRRRPAGVEAEVKPSRHGTCSITGPASPRWTLDSTDCGQAALPGCGFQSRRPIKVSYLIINGRPYLSR